VRHRYLYAAAGAYLALTRGDTVEAVRRLQALPCVAGQVWYERLTLARLLAALRREPEALAVLDREFPWAVPLPQHVMWALRRRVTGTATWLRCGATGTRRFSRIWSRRTPRWRASRGMVKADAAGQLGFMRNACIELARYGITVAQ
jgi:hypothetical protein